MGDATERLLQQLGGGMGGPPKTPVGGQAAGRRDANHPDEADQWSILLVEMVYLLNSCYRDAQYWEGIKAEKDTFRQFAKVLQQLAQFPGQDGKIRIAHRGSGPGMALEKPDYEVACGDLRIDRNAIGQLIKRKGIRFKHLEGRFARAVETFASESIDTLLLVVPEDSADEMDALRAALRILSCFRQAADKGGTISYSRNGRQIAIRPVQDEEGRPDLNLTISAALNDLSPEAMEDIVRKVAAMLKRPEAARLRQRVPNIFQAIFAVRSLSSKLRKPPLQVNGTRRQAADPAAGAPSGGRGGGGAGEGRGDGGGGTAGGTAPKAAGDDPPDERNGGAGVSSTQAAIMGDAGVKAALAHLVKDACKDTPEAVPGVMRSLFGQDYDELEMDGLGERLGSLSRLLGLLEQNPAGEQLAEAVLQRVKTGLDQLPDTVLNDLAVENGVARYWDGTRDQALCQVDERLASAIDQAKDNAAAGISRVRPVSGEEPVYMARDAEALASYFNAPGEEVKHILSHFRGCFDGNGNFQRPAFEKKVPEFARFPRNVIKVLWGFLKEMPARGDRVAFLNSMQLLVREIDQPIQAIRILLSDFTGERSQVLFPDRNAMMLANQFLRTYNKEINVDIELTPEEVLLVKVGLDVKVAGYSAWKVKGEQNRFLEKILAVRKRLMESLDPGFAIAAPMPVRFLLALEREVHMFLALAGGAASASILHSALTVYGNPDSQVFSAEESRPNLSSLLQHLAVLIRGIGRVGDENDLLLLDQLNQRERVFAKMSSDPRHGGLVRRVFGWIEPSKKEIGLHLRKRPSAAQNARQGVSAEAAAGPSGRITPP